MNFAHISVVLKNGIRYDANHLATAKRWGDDGSVVTFESSGHTHEFLASDVASVEYHEPRTDLAGDNCPTCGAGIPDLSWAQRSTPPVRGWGKVEGNSPNLSST